MMGPQSVAPLLVDISKAIQMVAECIGDLPPFEDGGWARGDYCKSCHSDRQRDHCTRGWAPRCVCLRTAFPDSSPVFPASSLPALHSVNSHTRDGKMEGAKLPKTWSLDARACRYSIRTKPADSVY
jgi:hypothetical protein